MYHIYMPVEMVPLMTKNRHYYNRADKSVAKSTHEVSASKATDHVSQFVLPSSVIELCKYS
jgi:hypothetical protein